MTEQPEDPLAEARLAGRLAGERFDATLRDRERREREDGLTRRVWTLPDEAGGGAAGESTGELWRLQREVERLQGFHDAVVRSRPWRLLQAARRPFGRAW
ncbi:MAG TPA: hypothetical protein VF121_14435 [Thermoanaerobaculia bacterium]|nr:hypothetical protein [Thermoanaerobaculia bacterium]